MSVSERQRHRVSAPRVSLRSHRTWPETPLPTARFVSLTGAGLHGTRRCGQIGPLAIQSGPRGAERSRPGQVGERISHLGVCPPATSDWVLAELSVSEVLLLPSHPPPAWPPPGLVFRRTRISRHAKHISLRPAYAENSGVVARCGGGPRAA